jgi:hypothetical protein
MNYIQQRIDTFGKDPETLDEFFECLKALIQSNLDVYESEISIIGLGMAISYTDSVRNNHVSPIGKPTNCNRYDPLPLGYPGFSGRIWVRYDKTILSFGDRPLENTLTHTGTGGFGTYDGPWEKVSNIHWKTYGISNYNTRPVCYSWDWRFFLEDWPRLQNKIQKEAIFKILQSKNSKLKYEKHWLREDYEKLDELFIYENSTDIL